MNKQDFREMVREMVKDFTKGKPELDQFIQEGRDLAYEFSEHDVVLGQKLTSIVDAVKDFGEYLLARSEEAKTNS